MEITKEVIRPGTYTYLDEQGKPAKFVADKKLIQHFFDSGKKMLAKGLSIPVPIEHQENAHPLTAAQKAAADLLNNSGWVKDFQLKDGILFSALEITDAKVAEKVKEKSIKWTSPWINTFTDGDGDRWNSVISHLALTSRPRAHRQEEFPSLAAAMSLFQKTETLKAIPEKGLSISRAGLVEHGMPLYPVAFSLWTGVKLSEEEMKEAKGKEKPKEKPGEKPGEKPPGKEGEKPPGKGETLPETPEGEPPPGETGEIMPMIEEALVDPDGDISVEDVICDLFEMLDPPIMIPEGDESNFRERVYTALMDHHKAGKMEPEPEATMPNTPPAAPPQSPVHAEPPPLLMSLEQINAIPDPTLKSIAMSLHQQGQSIEKFKAKEFEAKKRTRRERIAALAKFLPKELLDKFNVQAESVQLSLTATGDVDDPMELSLAGMEAVYNQIPILLKTPSAQLSLLRVPIENSTEAAKEAEKALAEKTANDLIARHHLPPEPVRA